MNPTHVHLVITHLPIFGSLLGALVLAYGLWRKSDPTKNAAYLIFLISAAGAATAYLTGEAAEEVVEKIPGVAENLIEQHEDFALYSLIAVLIMGGMALIALLIPKGKALASLFAKTILLVSLVSFVLVARTGYLGGQIRHTEINTASQAGLQETPDDDHD